MIEALLEGYSSLIIAIHLYKGGNLGDCTICQVYLEKVL